MKIRLLYLFLFLTYYSTSQTNPEELSVLFYNVENLFDTKDNPETDDNEFLPNGVRYWNYGRLNHKLLNISKVILSSGAWQNPGIVALCEIENRAILEKLLKFTPLKKLPYKIIHKESPDHRGIDVAFLYNSELFYPLNYKHFVLRNKDNTIKDTREILYVSGVWNKVDTLHFFVNHWPSRYSGLMETRDERKRAAALLKEKTDALFQKFQLPKIIIVGDFNDQPTDESIALILGAVKPGESIVNNRLYNLSANWLDGNEGTLKFQSQWSVFDQIIVSGTLLECNNGLYTRVENAEIIRLPFLIEKDEKYGGTKPFRTYYGYSYKGGFSDHLPVMLRLQAN